jgi:hypothetical protein
MISCQVWCSNLPNPDIKRVFFNGLDITIVPIGEWMHGNEGNRSTGDPSYLLAR